MYYESPNQMIEVDLNLIQQALAEYDKIIEEMTTAKEGLNNQLNGLDTVEWQSGAGRAFVEKMNTDWKINMEVYIASMTHMRQLLQAVYLEYQALSEQKTMLRLEGVI